MGTIRQGDYIELPNTANCEALRVVAFEPGRLVVDAGPDGLLRVPIAGVRVAHRPTSGIDELVLELVA